MSPLSVMVNGLRLTGDSSPVGVPFLFSRLPPPSPLPQHRLFVNYRWPCSSASRIILNGGHEKRTQGFPTEDKLQRLQVGYHTPLTHHQMCTKLKSTSVQHAWTDKILLAFCTKISIFSGFKKQLALGRTSHYWRMNRNRERVHLTTCINYGSQIFLSQIRNEEPSSRSVCPEPTSSIAHASAAAAQKKKQYETLKKSNNSIEF